MAAKTGRGLPWRGVAVPMDIAGVSPDSLKAAFSMAVDTLHERSDAEPVALAWSSFEMALQPDATDDTAIRMVARAKVLT